MCGARSSIPHRQSPGGPRLGHTSWTSQEPGLQAGPAQGWGDSNPRVSVCVSLCSAKANRLQAHGTARCGWVGSSKEQAGILEQPARPHLPQDLHSRLTPWQGLMATVVSAVSVCTVRMQLLAAAVPSSLWPHVPFVCACRHLDKGHRCRHSLSWRYQHPDLLISD